jgi:hypothetical protein
MNAYSQGYDYLIARIVEFCIGFSQFCTTLIGIAIVAQVIGLIFNLNVPGARADMRPLFHSLIYLLMCLTYVDIAPALDSAAAYIGRQASDKENWSAYSKEFKAKIAEQSLKTEQKLKNTPLVEAPKSTQDGTTWTPSTITPRDANTLENLAKATQKPDDSSLAGSIGSAVVGAIGQVFSVALLPLGLGTTSVAGSIALLARNVASLLAVILGMFLIGIGPLALVFSAIPGFGNSFKGWLVMVLGVKLWVVAFAIIDIIFVTLLSIFGDITKVGMQDFMLYTIGTLICAGMYMFVPTLLNLVWPNQGGAALQPMMSAISLASQAAQAAATGGASLAKKWS